ncbi:MAG: pantoate--beta-alanine ligase [Desulfobacterales bacterium]|nr:pantoate--beta-alanine ligase [Desulfobacterales bacterium]
MEIISDIEEMQAFSDGRRRQGQTIALVPTMGFLHAGHSSLMSRARQSGDILVVSIFVNPAQFGPGEDFATYPRNMKNDLSITGEEGVDIVFTPGDKALYPEGYETYVSLTNLPEHLCGTFRPAHFRGVATVVAKLFNIVTPHVAIFGQKDYQQLAVIRRMVRDLNFGIQIIGAPTVRDPDGLAMSSRNNYLTARERPAALSLYRSLMKAAQLVQSGVRDAARVIHAAAELIQSYADTKIDYVSICDPDTLDDVKTIDRPSLMALAVRVGKTRLIDNMILKP